jgi:hypothetical protein
VSPECECGNASGVWECEWNARMRECEWNAGCLTSLTFVVHSAADGDNKSTICCGVSRVRDAVWQNRLMPESSAVMGTIHKIVVRRFEQVVSCEDTTEDSGI